MRTKLVWLLLGAVLAIVATQAWAKTLTLSSADNHAGEYARKHTPVPSAEVMHDYYGCKRAKKTLSNGERIDDPHKVYCKFKTSRHAVSVTRCVQVTMEHKRNLLGQASYPVSERFVSTCPNPN